MISFTQALEIVRSVAQVAGSRLSVESVELTESVGRILAHDLVSHELLPAFDNSSMDGFAVHSRNTTSAPCTLKVFGVLAAGDVSKRFAEDGACEIMTGAPVPEAYNAVVKIEDVRVTRDAQGRATHIELSQPIASGTNVRRAGNDVKPGQVLLTRGSRIGMEHVLALAAVGIAKVPVFAKIRVARISTGKEIVAHTQTPNAGQIRNSTAPYLASVLPSLGATIVLEAQVGDDPREFSRAIADAIEKKVDLILTSGAVSMGQHDYVTQVLKEHQAQVHFHKVAIQPGKPILFASFPGGPTMFGLPGNPVSGMVGLRFFVEAFLRRLRAQPNESSWKVPLSAAVKKPAGLRQLAKAVLEFKEGAASVRVLSGQMSSMVAPLLESNAWAALPENLSDVPAGQTVDVYPLFSTYPFAEIK